MRWGTWTLRSGLMEFGAKVHSCVLFLHLESERAALLSVPYLLTQGTNCVSMTWAGPSSWVETPSESMFQFALGLDL